MWKTPPGVCLGSFRMGGEYVESAAQCEPPLRVEGGQCVIDPCALYSIGTLTEDGTSCVVLPEMVCRAAGGTSFDADTQQCTVAPDPTMCELLGGEAQDDGGCVTPWDPCEDIAVGDTAATAHFTEGKCRIQSLQLPICDAPGARCNERVPLEEVCSSLSEDLHYDPSVRACLPPTRM